MTKNIYDISEEYMSIISELEESEGELTPELESRLRINQEEFRAKALAYVHVIRMTEGEMTIIKEETERLEGLMKARETKRDKLKEKLKDAVLLFGEDGKSGNKTVNLITAKLFTTNRKSVFIEDEDDFVTNKDNYKYCKASLEPLEYGTILRLNEIALKNEINTAVTKPIISKNTIKEDLDLEIEVNGAQLVTKPFLTIK